MFVSLKYAVLVSESSKDGWLVKNGSGFYFGDYGVKESAIVRVPDHFSHWNEQTEGAGGPSLL